MILGIFIIGALTFIIAFSFFKSSAFRKTKNDQSSWPKLVSVFVVDYLVLVLGVLASGILFVSIFNMAHG